MILVRTWYAIVVEELEGIGRGSFIFGEKFIHEVTEEDDAGAVSVELFPHNFHIVWITF